MNKLSVLTKGQDSTWIGDRLGTHVTAFMGSDSALLQVKWAVLNFGVWLYYCDGVHLR